MTDEITKPLGFGEYIREVRLSRRLSLTKAAKRFGMKPQRLCDIESGRRFAKSVPLEFITKVSKNYEVPLTEVVKASTRAIQTERTVLELVNEIAPSMKMAELLAAQLLETSKNLPPAVERMAANIQKHVGDARVLFWAIRTQLVSDGKESLIESEG